MTTETIASTAEPEVSAKPVAPDPRSPSRVGRILAVVATVVALLMLLSMVGGGWYFSGRIHADALQVNHPAPSYGLEVVSVGRGSITIADPDNTEPALDGDAVYGVEWDGGYGQLSGPDSGDEAVTRRFELLSGKAPRKGTLVALDRPAFGADPEGALGRPVATVKFGGLKAWYAEGRSKTWAVLVHGKGGTRTEMLRMMRRTTQAGMPSMAITYRNDEDAPPDPSGLYQFGSTEWRDLGAAVEYATARGAKKVVLVGASMGGGIIASYLRNTVDAPVSGVVLDSPMLDFGATISYGAEQEPLPLLGAVPAPLTWTAKQITALRYGVDWAATDYLEDTSWLAVPALVIHGGADLTVPLATSEQLRDADPERVRLVVVPEAEHVESWNVDPATYEKELDRFLSKL